MKRLIMFTFCLFSFSHVWASENSLSEICRQHTEGSHSYEICMKHSVNLEITPVCAQFTLNPTNTFKTLPFQKCQELSKSRHLSQEQISQCGGTAGTHKGFIKCLENI